MRRLAYSSARPAALQGRVSLAAAFSPLPTRQATNGPSRATGGLATLQATAAHSTFPTSSSLAPSLPLHARHASTAAPPPSPARKPLFDKILIANRGEIACRVIRTARKLGIKTVAVYSAVDAESQHVKMADEAYYIGPAPSTQSYLCQDKYIEICKKSGAQAIHPGYGFLSENADFARLLEENDIVFIGPPASAITSMGSKAESKDIMLAAGVPCVPGWHPSTSFSSSSDEDTQSPSFLLDRADEIGYPVLIKAVSGGGGKGMKIAAKKEEFVGQLESAKREARTHFGDDRVLLERYITRPRHVEVQVFSDSHGNHLSLFERDCSVQRRHQKVIEEAPAPGLKQELREKLYDKARKAAEAVDYRGAGTVEFILNAENEDEFFFCEMNVRLQVEHPVTEAVTGVDLVEWQLEVAAGNPIPLKQEEITCTGHAFECRIYAENPRNGFLPDAGLLLHHRPPASSDTVRFETGFVAGDDISVTYDPLIAKAIFSGPDRTSALRTMRKGLNEYQVVGPSTNIEFLGRLAANEAFVRGEVETGFIQKHYDELFPPLPSASSSSLAAAALYLADRDRSHFTSLGTQSAWTASKLAGFRLGGVESNRYRREYEFGEKDGEGVKVQVGPTLEPTGMLDVSVAPTSTAEEVATLFPAVSFSSSSSTSDPHATTVRVPLPTQLTSVDIISSPAPPTPLTSEPVPEVLHLFNAAEGFAGKVEVKPPSWMSKIGTAAAEGKGKKGRGGAVAPMPSKIVQVFVKEGDVVEEGAPLVTLEAMKTEHVLKAAVSGKIAKVVANEGDLVPAGKVLVEFAVEEAEESA
ncbi:hypothetical protein JCM8097_005179 [Rhodosporidiobolus ruineniae]